MMVIGIQCGPGFAAVILLKNTGPVDCSWAGTPDDSSTNTYHLQITFYLSHVN
jgi:hypothetical protein